MPALRSATGDAHIATFYSFKGGVGRSLLLANVGWLLSARRRVVLWDLDVEAPGLHLIPSLRPPEVKRGFLEWLADWQGANAFQTKGRLAPRDAKALARLVLPVPARPNLSILPAFGDGADFARLYAEGQWRRFLVEEPALGLALFDAVLGLLGEGRQHVLIDSRTGITDLGGFLAALLPHATVLVGGYGHQSVHGLLHVKRALEPATQGRWPQRERLGGGARLQLVHAVSPVPEDEAESAERRRTWATEFGSVRPIEIPWDRRLLWTERLLAADDPEGATARAYAQVTERLSGLRDELLASAEAVRAEAARDPQPERGLEFGPRRGWSFEERVKRLLELHGYAVEPKQVLGGHEIDLVARRTGGLDEECWWVECKDHRQPVRKEVLEKLAAWVGGQAGSQRNARAMVVGREFTPAAVSFAKDRPDLLRVWTVDDLERRLFDPRPYLHTLVTGFEQSSLSRTYVEQRALLEGKPEDAEPVDLLAHALAWAEGDGPRLWLLLGDYGTGKTSFFQRFSAELARRALADPEAPFPVAVDLKLVANATSAETLLFEHLRQRAPLFRGNPEALVHLLSAGRCVLLLDAFDEMGVAAAGRSVEEQFRELARLTGEEPLEPRRGNRVLVTCRAHFFRDQQQVKDTAAGRPGGLVAAEGSALGRLARRFNAEIDEICLFDDRQIADFLEKHLGAADAVRARDFIGKTYGLQTLAPRPVLLEMIVQSLPRLWREKAGQLTPAGLYEIYTRQWLEDRSGRHLQTSAILRHRLLTLLAAVLWRSADRQLHHRELLDEVRRLEGLFPGLDHDRVDVELRTAAFLVRSADGYYRFSHKSFLEFFLARGLWEKLGAGGEEAAVALDLPALSPEVGDFFWQMPAGGYMERLAVLRAILQAPYRARIGENALRLGVWSRTSTGVPFEVEDARLAGAHLEGEDLRGVRLPAADLSGAGLGGCDLTETCLPGARLDGADLRGALAAGADLTAASLEESSLQRADLSRACLCRANLPGADLRESILDDTDLSGACLAACDLTGASGDRSCFATADLRHVRLGASVWTRPLFAGSLLEGAEAAAWLVAEEDLALPLAVPVGRLEGLEARVDFRSGHWGWVRAVAWSADGQRLASGGDDGTVRVWDGETGALARELVGTGGSVWSLAWAPSGRELAAGSDDGTVRVWDGETGALARELGGIGGGTGGTVWSLAWAPSGRELASGSADGKVRVCVAATGALARELGGPGGSVWSVAWAPSGRELAAGSADGTVRVWDAETGAQARELGGTGGSVWSLAWAPSGRELAAGSTDVRVWDGETGAVARDLDGVTGSSVSSLAWAPSGRDLAAGSTDGTVRVWDWVTGALARELGGSGSSVWSLAWAPSGRELAAGSEDGTVRVWDGETVALARELRGSGAGAGSVAWAPSGRELAVGSEDGTVRVWDGVTGALARELGGAGGSVLSLAWAPSGRELAIGSEDGTVQVWDGETGAPEWELWGPQGRVSSVAWAPSGRELAAASTDEMVRVWEVETGALARELGDTRGRVLSVAWAPSGRELAAGSLDGFVRVWDVATGALARALGGTGGSVWSVAWAPSGLALAAGSSDGTVRVWELETSAVARELGGGGGRISSFAWAPSGLELAVGSQDGFVRVWEVETGALARELAGTGGRVLSVAWAPSGRELAAGSADGTVRVWNEETWDLKVTFQTRERMGLATVPGGWFIHSPREEPLDSRRFCLLTATPSPGIARGWRVLPLGGLARYLESPERVRASLAGERQAAAILPGPQAPAADPPKKRRRRRGA
jgi:WD40 repeat protein/uncharacterized protein YjbI with pentapeptide repeats